MTSKIEAVPAPSSEPSPRVPATPSHFFQPHKASAARTLGWLAISAYVLVRLLGLTRYDLNGAETFLLDGIRMSWRGMFDYMAADMVHPPLSYLLLRLWVAAGGESLLWLRLFPASAAIASLVPLLLLCRELRLKPGEVNLTLGFSALNAYLIHHAQEMRMYSLFLFFSMCSAWLFIRFINRAHTKPDTLFPLSIANLLLIYTHYFGWLLVMAEFVVLLICARPRLRSFAISVGVLGLCFFPWAVLVGRYALQLGSTIDWIPRPSLSQVAAFVANLNGPLLRVGTIRPGLLLFAIPLVVWSIRIFGRRRNTLAGERILFWFLSLACFGTVAAVFVASWVLPDAFWFERYFIFMAPLYMILISVSVSRFGSRAVSSVGSSILLAWALVAGVDDIRTERLATTEIGSRVKWEPLAREVGQLEDAANGAGEITVYTIPVRWRGRLTGDWIIETSMKYHLEHLGHAGFRFVYSPSPDALLASERPAQFWVASFELHDAPSGLLRERLVSHGYRVDEVESAAGRNRVVLLRVRSG